MNRYDYVRPDTIAEAIAALNSREQMYGVYDSLLY